MAFRSASTPTSSNGTAVSIAKPAGVASGDIVLLFVTTDVSGKTCSTPTGFTAYSTNGQATPDGHSNFAFWRRFDGGEGANITCTIGGGGDDWIAQCAAWSGRHATDPPVVQLTTPNTSSNATPVSVALTGVTASTGDDIAWWGSLDKTTSVSWTFSPPGSYTEASDTTLGWCASSLAYRDNVSSGATGTLTATATGTNSAGFAGYVVRIPVAAGGSPAVLSSPTPSGTLSTNTTATIGCTTDTTSGTFYCVVDSAANLSGVTATQIKAGQKASGAAALASANSTVSTTTPSAGVTGLTQNTLYSYAIVQNSANGDSNVVTGTFTTADHFTLTVDSGSGAFEGANISLLFDAAYVLSVTGGSATMEGQEIPFQLLVPGTQADLAGQGSDITLLALATLTVDHGQATMQGQNITFGEQFILAVDSGAGAFTAMIVNLAATGQAVTSGIAPFIRRRRRK